MSTEQNFSRAISVKNSAELHVWVHQPVVDRLLSTQQIAHRLGSREALNKSQRILNDICV